MNSPLNWNQLLIYLSPFVSVISIFISNWLGRLSEKSKYRQLTLEKTYLNYYVPLMKFLATVNKESMTFYWMVAAWYLGPESSKSNAKLLSNLLRTNIELLPPKIVMKISKFSGAVSGTEMFFGEGEYRENYRHNLIEGSELFDEIIIESLKEASTISKKLGYPNIAKPLLESFQSMEQNQRNHPRYLPEIYQKQPPRVFQGSKPPYY